jgi:glycerol-3-phosphate dehydrogenase (NAD(P)+)
VSRLAILGGGSWGTALSMVLGPRFECVRLWVFEPDLAERMSDTRQNDEFLPGFTLPENVEVTSSLPVAVKGAETVLGVMPSHHARHVYTEVLPALEPGVLMVSATKGIENITLLRMSEVIGEVVSREFHPRVVALSGPTFARDVAQGAPTALVAASADMEFASRVQAAFSGPTFRVYANTDPVGVEIGAALKNVIAIGAGVCYGLELGHNAVAALITRGLAEITRLAVSLGGKASTLAGLAGLGDLVLTCTGDLSRNRMVGLELAKGRELADIVGGMRMVAEGVQTTFAAVDLARRQNVEVPIISQMDQMLRLGKPPRDAVRELMDRSLKPE